MRLVILLLSSISFASVSLAQDSPPLLYPADCGYINIAEKYGARGDGTTDDTVAFQKAIDDNVRRLFIPEGTYLLSGTLVFGPKRWQLQGAGQKHTILRLKDNADGLGDVENPRPFISTFGPFRDPKAAMGQAFRNSLYDLTIEVGAGNPGAVGLHYLSNNQGTVRNVMIRSLDPQRRGKAGLAMVTNWPGPSLLRNVTIEGFDLGIWLEGSQYGATGETIRLFGQREAGISNRGQTLSLGHVAIDSANQGRDANFALTSSGSTALTTIQYSDAASAKFQASEDATLVLDRVPYNTGVLQINSPILGDGKNPLHAPRGDRSDPRLPEMSKWVNVQKFGALPIEQAKDSDAALGIQKAIDSGAELIYFPFGTYLIKTPIRAGGKLMHIHGMESRFRYQTGDEPAWRIVDPDEPPSNPFEGTGPSVPIRESSLNAITFDRLDGDYESTSKWIIDHASKRTLMIRDCMIGGYRNTVTGAFVHLEDVCGSNWDFKGQTIFARQLNTEARGDDFNIRLRDSRFWALGVKTEGPKTVVNAEDSEVTLFGGFFYANRGTDVGAAALDVKRTKLLASWVNHLGGSYRPQVRQDDRELFLHVDFTEPDNLRFVQREIVAGEVVAEKIDDKQTKPANRSPYRHGSYGVKVPLYVGGF